MKMKMKMKMRERIRSFARLVLVGLVISFASAGAFALAPVTALGQTAGSRIELSVDSPTSGAELVNGRAISIGGWAGEQGDTGGTGILDVDVFLDGQPTSGGTYVGAATYGLTRTDVPTVTGESGWTRSGFSLDWIPRGVTYGQHTLSVVAYSVSGASQTVNVSMNGCGCGVFFQPSVTDPAVRVIPGVGYELDTGGPGVWIERYPDFSPTGQ